MKRYDDAIEQYQKALALDPTNDADVNFNLGVSLSNLNRYDEAIVKYREAAKDSRDLDYQTSVYSSFNIADIYFEQGRYREAWIEFGETLEGFEQNFQKAKEHEDAFFFGYYGELLRNAFGRLNDAEWAYKKGLNFDKDNLLISLGLIQLYFEQKEIAPEESRPRYHWQALGMYKNVKTTLEKEILTLNNRITQESKDPHSFHLLQASNYLDFGKLEIIVEAYDRAEENLRNALKHDSNLINVYNQLGLVFAKKKQFKKSIAHFEEAKRQKIYDLTIRSNLAETYFKAELIDKAEKEYREILSIAPQNVESLIGLGELYIARGGGEEEDAEMFAEAIRYFSHALELTEPLKGSKRMTSKEVASVYYSRGYARIQLFETSKIKTDEGLLWKARSDFKICFKKDPTNHKALRSKQKIDKTLDRFSPRRIWETLGGALIASASLFVFVISQSTFFFQLPKVDLDPIHYVLLTFGSLILAISGIFLPQLLKLKFAGIELEKTSIDQIKTTGRLEIRK